MTLTQEQIAWNKQNDKKFAETKQKKQLQKQKPSIKLQNQFEKLRSCLKEIEQVHSDSITKKALAKARGNTGELRKLLGLTKIAEIDRKHA